MLDSRLAREHTSRRRRARSLRQRTDSFVHCIPERRSPQTVLLDSLGERPVASPKTNRRTAVADNPSILPGILDLLILKAVSLGKLHGYGVLLRIEQISG